MTLDEFLQSVERRAFKMAVLATRNHADALDIVQDAMLKLVNNYREKTSLEWPKLFQRILQNCILDWHRSRTRQNRFYWWKRDSHEALDDDDEYAEHWESTVEDSSGETPQALLACAQDIDKVSAAIELLPIRQQQAFLLRSWEGFDVESTSEIMGCAKSSVKTHHARALTTLRTALEAGSEYIERIG